MNNNTNITGVVTGLLGENLKKLPTSELLNCQIFIEKLLAERQEKILQKNKRE